MSAFKRFNKSDIVTLPIVANKEWTLNHSTLPPTGSEYTVYKGKNLTGSFEINNDPVTSNQYERLMYDMINHTFYQSYTASLNTSSLASGNYFESASQDRPTG